MKTRKCQNKKSPHKKIYDRIYIYLYFYFPPQKEKNNLPIGNSGETYTTPAAV